MLLKLRNRHLLALDALLLGTLSVLALVMRYEGFDWPAGTNQTLFWSLLIGLPIKLFIFWAFGLYKGLWQYASLAELERIFVAGAVAAVVSFVRGAILFPALGLEEDLHHERLRRSHGISREQCRIRSESSG